MALVAGASVVLMVALAVWAMTQKKEAVKQRTEAVKQKGIAETKQRESEVAKEEAEQQNYANLIAQAQSKVDEGALDQIETMLWNTPQKHRGWEWGHVLQLCQSDFLTLKGHGDTVTSVAFSPDGRRVVTGSWDNTVKIRDAERGTVLLALKSHARDVWSVAFSPDGRRVVTGSGDKTAKIWDAVDWTLTREEFEKQKLERYQAWLKTQEQNLAALARARPLAEKGDAQAQFELGKLYLNDHSTLMDHRDAVIWFGKAAKQGHAEAQSELTRLRGSADPKIVLAIAEQGDVESQGRLGYMYAYGRGVEKDEKESAKWYRKAAEQNHSKAQASLGWMYQAGLGVKQDYAEALKWHRKAIEQGNTGAQNNLGVMYRDGAGVAEDADVAVKWFRKAAEQGNTRAPYNLGRMYAAGRGIEEDPVEAYKWCSLTITNGYARAKPKKDALAKKMTPEQITKAKALAKEMIEQNPKLLPKK